MGQGIMTMAANGNMGVGNEPPVNFNLGGEVRRRGDEDPVPVFEQGGAVQYFAPENINRVASSSFKPYNELNYTPMPSKQDYINNQIGKKLYNNQLDLAKAYAMTQQNQNQASSNKTLQELYEEKKGVYSGILGSAEEQKNLTQSQILFDIANTALAFAAPMEGEKAGLSAAQRLAMAARQTKLPQTIAARAAAQNDKDDQLKLAALTSAEKSKSSQDASSAAYRQKQMEVNAAYKQKEMELKNKRYALTPEGKLVSGSGEEIALGVGKTFTLSEGQKLIRDGKEIFNVPKNYKLGVNEVIKDKNNKIIASGRIFIKGLPKDFFDKMEEVDRNVYLGLIGKDVKGVPIQYFNKLSKEGQDKLMFGSETVKGVPKIVFDSLSPDEQGKIMGTIPLKEETVKGIPKSIFNKFNQKLQNHILGATQTMKPGDKIIDISTGDEIASAPEKTIFKQINGQIVSIDPNTGDATPIFGDAKIEAEYINVTIDGVTQTVNVKTKTGFDYINTANEMNKVKPGSVTIKKLGTESNTQIKPTAFLLKDQNKVVTSYDNGQTYLEDGKVMSLTEVNAIPVSSTIAAEVHSKEMVKFRAKEALVELDLTLVSNLGRDFDTNEKKTVSDVLQQARDGTGFGAQFLVMMQKGLGLLPGDIRNFFPNAEATLDANNYMKTITVIGRSALVVNNKFPVKEMENVAKLFPDADSFLTSPDVEVRKITNLRNASISQIRRNLKELSKDGIGDKQKEALLANNLEINRLISMTGGYTTGSSTSSSSSSSNQNKILQSKQLMQRNKTNNVLPLP